MKRNIIKLNEIGSTNDYMRKYALADDDEMAVTVASYQTAGRGQGTNTWESEPGKNLLFSLKLKPKNVEVRTQFLLSMTMAVAIKEALDCYADGFSLKWPNDIYWHDYKL